MSEEEIKCGELYCEYCGDCYHCYADDPCVDDTTHWFDFDKERNSE